MSKIDRFLSVRRPLRPLSLAVAALACLVVAPLVVAPLSGCGGSTARRVDETGNRLIIPLDWPARTRALPQAANSVRVDIVRGDTVVARKEARRPDGDSASTVNLTFDNVPNGDITVRVTAHPDNDAAIIELARGTFPVRITSGTTTLPPITLQSELVSLNTVPDVKSLNLGQQQEVAATPRNAQGQYVLALASNYTWETSAPTIVQVQVTTGDRAILRAQGIGQATVTVTERESGLRYSSLITVTSQSETPEGSRYRYTVIADSASEVDTFGTPSIDDNGRVWFVGGVDGGGKAVYAGSNGILNRYADTTGAQFADLGEVGDVSRNGSAVVFTGQRRGNSFGAFLLQNDIITQIATEAGDIRNLSSDTVVNDGGTIAYVAQADEGFSGQNTRNIYRWKGGTSQRVYLGPSPTNTPDLLEIDTDDTIYFRDSEGGGSVSRVTGGGAVEPNVALPFDKNVSAFSVISQGTTVAAFGTQIAPVRELARRNRAGQIVFLASGADGRTLLLRADPVP